MMTVQHEYLKVKEKNSCDMVGQVFIYSIYFALNFSDMEDKDQFFLLKIF